MLSYYPIERENRIFGPRPSPDVDCAKLAEPATLSGTFWTVRLGVPRDG